MSGRSRASSVQDHLEGRSAMSADSISLLFAVALAYVPIAIRARILINRKRESS